MLGTAMDASPPSCRQPLTKKRKLEEGGKRDTTKQKESSATTTTKPQLSFRDEKNITHPQSDPAQDFPEEYKESDIWYSVSSKTNTIKRADMAMIAFLCRKSPISHTRFTSLSFLQSFSSSTNFIER